MVAGGHLPVEVVLVEYVDDRIEVYECNFFGIERSEEGWRQVMVKRACLADGKYQLYERLVDVGLCALLRLGP